MNPEVVVSCRDDEGARTAIDGLTAELEGRPGYVVGLSLENLIAEFEEYASTEFWANEFRRRYLDLTPIVD